MVGTSEIVSRRMSVVETEPDSRPKQKPIPDDAKKK